MNLQKSPLIGRCIVSTLICVFFALSSYASPISRQQASARALKFLNDKSASIKNGDVQQSPAIGNVAELSTAYESDAYYVFNVGKDSGFVIVGGDDIAKPILGYADKGSFNANHIPDNMKAWLNTYAQQIKEAQRSGKTSFKAATTGTTRHSTIRKRIPVLMTTLWGQDAPYNDFEANKYPTGCVATALAQIMKYHNWPESTTKTIPAYSEYPELQPTSFDWNNMLDDYENVTDHASSAAVSTLMKYIGYAVRMQYNPNGSGAYSVDVPYAVANYFGYDNARYISSDECSSYEDWIDTVYTELEKNGPVYFSAISPFAGGHAFVCDGYDGDDNFHFNWGWDGEGNGYFALAALSVGIYDFCLGQNIVSMPKGKNTDCDKRPIKLTSDRFNTADSLTYKRKSIDEDFTDIKIEDYRAASFSRNCNVDYSLALFKDGKIVSILPKRTLEYDGSQRIYGSSVTVSLGKGLEGKYELRQVSKESGSSEWLTDYGSDNYHFDVEITGNNMAIKKYVIGSEIEIKSVEYIGDTSINGIYAFDIVNHGYDFDGILHTHIFHQNYASPYYSHFHTKLKKGEHKIVNVSNRYDSAMGKTITVTLEREEDSYVIYDGIIDTTQVKLKADVIQLNAKDGKSFGGYIGIKAKITNIDTTAYNRYVKCFLSNKTSGFFEATVAYQMHLKPGESKEQTFDFIIDKDFDNATRQTYCIKLVGYGYKHRRSGALSEITELYTSDNFNVVPGVVFFSDDKKVVSGGEATSHITVPEEANAVDMRYTTGLVTDVTRNSNPNTLYYLDAADNEPSGLAAANVIKSGNAHSINLTDGYGFCVPVDFRASEVSFSRNFSSNKWNTFVAPFDIEGSDVERLYAKEFIAEDDNNIYFGDAQRISANMPYLVFDCIGNKTFKAQNVNFISMDPKSASGRDYRFISTYSPVNSENIYLLNSDGSEFAKAGKSDAFRAYFMASDGNIAPADKLNVVLEGTIPPSSAEEIEADTTSDKTVVARYSVDGIKLPHDAKGFVIERHADGSVSKRFAR